MIYVLIWFGLAFGTAVVGLALLDRLIDAVATFHGEGAPSERQQRLVREGLPAMASDLDSSMARQRHALLAPMPTKNLERRQKRVQWVLAVSAVVFAGGAFLLLSTTRLQQRHLDPIGFLLAAGLFAVLYATGISAALRLALVRTAPHRGALIAGAVGSIAVAVGLHVTVY